MPRPSRKPRTISRWDQLIADLSSPDQLNRLCRCRVGRHRFIVELHYPLGVVITSRRAGLLNALSFLTAASILGLLVATRIRPNMLEPIVSDGVIATALCLLTLAAMPAFFQASRAAEFPALSLLSLRRTLAAAASRAGRRSQAKLDTIAASQPAYAAAWSAFHAAKRNNVFPSGRLLDSSSRPFLFCGIILMGNGFVAGNALDLALGVRGLDLIFMVTGLILIAWGLSLRPAARNLRRLLQRHAARHCPDCDFDLTSHPPALPTAPNLGPAICPECGVPWPLVLPAPPWPAGTDLNARQTPVAMLRRRPNRQ